MEAAQKKYKTYFWNRGAFQLDLSDDYVYFDMYSDLKKGKASKAVDFLRFRRWLIENLRKDRPEKIVVLSTLTGVMLESFLNSTSVPYVFDIRDYSYEHFSLFYQIEQKLINNSAFTAISSKGFKCFLPAHEYIIAHNFNRNDIVNGIKFQRQEGKISFVWNGVIRYFDFQKGYLNELKNDKRFEIVFHGDGPQLELFKSYCKHAGFENVRFTGAYENANKQYLLKSAGILNNCYGYIQHAGNKLKYAISNRFYDGIIYHIPQLVEPIGYKSDLVRMENIGVNFRAEDGFADKLYKYYESIDPAQFDTACENALQNVIKEDDEYIRRIDQFINS